MVTLRCNCLHCTLNSGLPVQQLDSLDFNEEVGDSVQDEHHVISMALSTRMRGSNLLTFSTALVFL